MNKIFLFFSLIIIHFGVISQENPVSWKINYQKNNSEIKYEANIEPHWHLYAANLPDPDEGPLQTEFKYDESQNFKVSNHINESKTIKTFDENFGIDVSYFENSAVFTQKLKIYSEESFTISGKIYYMVCNEKMCIPFEEPFKIVIDP